MFVEVLQFVEKIAIAAVALFFIGLAAFVLYAIIIAIAGVF